jgi:two-component system chemotaxis response regulator CheY
MPSVTVLIVEDDLNIRDTLEDALADEGHTVFVARNGADAVASLNHLPRPALIVLDLWMPVMDGLGFFRELRARKDRNDFEVVITTAAVAPDWFIGAPGIVKVLRKPFDIDDILSVISEFAARRTSGGASATMASRACRERPGGSRRHWPLRCLT